MIVGLLDWDLIQWKQPTVFNLELMKLAYYHKVKKRDLVQMESRFSSDKCTKVFIQKDYEDYNYPENIIQDPKVTWRGNALSKSYFYLGEEIEKCPADTSIYSGLEKYYQDNEHSRILFRRMMNGCHLRLSLDEKTISDVALEPLKDLDKKVHGIFLHDKDIIEIKGSLEMTKYILEKYGTKNVLLGTKFPLMIQTDEQMLEWSKIPRAALVRTTYLKKILSNETIIKMDKNIQDIYYIFEKTDWDEEKIVRVLPKIFIQAVFLSKYSIPILLKVDPEIQMNDQWKAFIELFNNYILNSVNYASDINYSCFSYCKYSYLNLFKDDKIKLFSFIKEHNNDLFNLLYDVEYVIIENDNLVGKLYTLKEIEDRGGYGGKLYRKRDSYQNRVQQTNYSKLIQGE